MADTKWTPGPWGPGIALTYKHAVVGAPRGRNAKRDVVARCSVPKGHAVEAEPNARLIAAAPDLYEALARLLAVARENLSTAFSDEMQDAEVALAKARGEKSNG